MIAGSTGLLMAVLAMATVGLLVWRHPTAAARCRAEIRWTGRRLRWVRSGDGLARRPPPPPPQRWSALASAAGTGDAAPGRSILIRDGRLLLVFDLRPTPGGRPPGDGLLAALDPLTSMTGITVDSIHWIYDIGDAPARTLVVLSLDPEASRHAIDARGGGSAGADRVVMLTLARATALLAPHGLRTRFLDATAAAPALSGLDDRRVGDTARLHDHPSQPTVREHRREMMLADRWHRAQRLDPTGVRTLWRSGSTAQLAAEVHRLVEARAPGARITATVWTRAGPDGTRHGGSLRLTARDRRDLDDLTADLDRAARRQGVRIGPFVAAQQPHLMGALLSRPG